MAVGMQKQIPESQIHFSLKDETQNVYTNPTGYVCTIVYWCMCGA